MAIGPHAHRRADLVQPTEQGGLQGLRLEAVEDTFEGVVRGDAVGQFQEATQPVLSAASEGLDVGPRVGAGDDGADGEDEDV